MHLGGLIEEQSPAEMQITLLDYICFKQSRSSLQELRLLLGQHLLLELLNKLAGSYILLPSSKHMQRMTYDYAAALTVRRIKQARKERNLSKWNREEANLQKIAKKSKRTYKNTYMRGIQVLKETERIEQWKKRLEAWGKKFLTQP